MHWDPEFQRDDYLKKKLPTGCAESTGTQKGVALNRGMPHPPNFEGCIVKVFFIHFQNFEFLSST